MIYASAITSILRSVDQYKNLFDTVKQNGGEAISPGRLRLILMTTAVALDSMGSVYFLLLGYNRPLGIAELFFKAACFSAILYEEKNYFSQKEKTSDLISHALGMARVILQINSPLIISQAWLACSLLDLSNRMINRIC